MTRLEKRLSIEKVCQSTKLIIKNGWWNCKKNQLLKWCKNK
jgi:hypothetical protein